MLMLHKVLEEFGFPTSNTRALPFGTGLINHTWKIQINGGGQTFILQRINGNVFKNPKDIAGNVQLIAEYLAVHYPSYLFVRPLKSNQGQDLVFVQGEGYFRMMPYILRSHSLDVVKSPEQAFEAAKQFGRFTRLLCGFDVSKLKVTIPDFHNLPFRYRLFEESTIQGNPERIALAVGKLDFMKELSFLVDRFSKMDQKGVFKLRVTHHDAKISNVLFDKDNHGLCVIDLDTVMPGYFISDVGDMMRTYLSPVSEEERDFSKILVREEYYKAIVKGYLSEMKGELSEEEEKCFFDAGCFLIYMQALRFMTDYLNNDRYYGAKGEGQNFHRACNQLVLLKRLLERENQLRAI